MANGSSTDEQGWLRSTSFNATINAWYEYASNSTEIAEAGYAEDSTVPVGDCEPPYDGAAHYGAVAGQQLRERSYATFLEGGSLINYGHEDWWPFGLGGLYSEGLTWQQVGGHDHTIQQSYAWTLLDQYVADPTWLPDGSFLTTGTGDGDTKAAAGHSDTAAVAYFPSSRSIAVNTTVISTTDPVRLRWYDPTTGTYTVISQSETPQPNRTVPYPPTTHGDSTSDWTLVIDRVSGKPPTTTTTTAPATTTTTPTTTTTAPAITTTTAPATTTTTPATTPGTGSTEPAYVQGVARQVTSGDSNTVTFHDSNRAGDLIVVYVLWSNAGDVTITDTNGNTYRPAGRLTGWNNGRAGSAVFYAANVADGPNTITATFATSITAAGTPFGIVYAHEYANIAPTDPLEAATSATGATASVTAGPLTTTTDGDLLFVASGSTAKVQLTDPTYTTRSNQWENVTGDNTSEPAGTHTVTGTHNGTAWVTHLVAFKPAATT